MNIIHLHSLSGSNSTAICEASLAWCNYNLTTMAGNFTSPGFPNEYPNDTCCSYQITGEEGKSIKIEFLHFNLEFEPNCNHDSVKIYEGNSTNGILMKTLCGNGSRIYSSVGNKLYVLFKSDFSIAYQGFFARFNASAAPSKHIHISLSLSNHLLLINVLTYLKKIFIYFPIDFILSTFVVIFP